MSLKLYTKEEVISIIMRNNIEWRNKIEKIKDKAIKDNYGNFTIDIDEIDKICEEEKE